MPQNQRLLPPLPTFRGQQTTRRYGVADQPAPRRDRTPAPDQNGEAMRFHPPADRPHPHVSPFRPRPGSLPELAAHVLAAVIALGRNPALWGGAIALFTLMIMRAAAYPACSQAGHRASGVAGVKPLSSRVVGDGEGLGAAHGFQRWSLTCETTSQSAGRIAAPPRH